MLHILNYLQNTKVFFFAAALISLSFLIYFLLNHYIYIQYDAYYYAAIADNVITGNGFRNIVTDPSSPIRTPQNGIVYIHLLLAGMGVEDIGSRIQAITILNSFFIVLASFVIYKIGIIYISNRYIASWLGLSVVASFYYQIVLLQSINDAFFFLLCTLSIYLIADGKKNSKKWLIIISLMISHFRISGCIIFFVASLSYFISKDHKSGIYHLGLFFLSIVSLAITGYFLDIDVQGIDTLAGEITNKYSVGYFIDHLWHTINLSIGEAFIRVTYFTAGFTLPHPVVGVVLSVPILALVFYTLYRGYKTTNKNYLFIALLFLGFLAFFQVHPAQPTRYIIILSPFMPLLFLLYIPDSYKKTFSHSFVILVVIVSLLGVSVSNKGEIGNLKYIFSKNIRSQIDLEKYQLISHFPRLTYFLLKKRATDVKNYTGAFNNKLLITGPDTFVRYILEYLKTKKKLTITHYEILPYYYIDYTRSDMKQFGFNYKPIIVTSALVTVGKPL